MTSSRCFAFGSSSSAPTANAATTPRTIADPTRPTWREAMTRTLTVVAVGHPAAAPLFLQLDLVRPAVVRPVPAPAGVELLVGDDLLAVERDARLRGTQTKDP